MTASRDETFIRYTDALMDYKVDRTNNLCLWEYAQKLKSFIKGNKMFIPDEDKEALKKLHNQAVIKHSQTQKDLYDRIFVLEELANEAGIEFDYRYVEMMFGKPAACYWKKNKKA